MTPESLPKYVRDILYKTSARSTDQDSVVKNILSAIKYEQYAEMKAIFKEAFLATMKSDDPQSFEERNEVLSDQVINEYFHNLLKAVLGYPEQHLKPILEFLSLMTPESRAQKRNFFNICWGYS